ncbi:MAG: TlpA family protein disulfide reductase [Clostridiales bacterium]|nr:TlpA family protein disulfide reductase [Clostridiales bacterium]
MKNYIKYILIAISLIAVVAFALFGYNYLSSRYQPEEPNRINPDTPVESGNSKGSINQATDFTVIDMDGNNVKLSDYFGKPIVINFWATWCGPCKSELPTFDKLYSENKDDVVFLMVNLTDGYRDTTKSVKEFFSDNGYAFPVYFDTEYSAANAYRVSSIPMTVFIDKSGAVAASHVGVMSETALDGYLSELLSE